MVSRHAGIASAERPVGIVEGDKYDTSVATEILVSKYGYHLPIYRQQDKFAGTGWTPSRSTMLNILVNCYFLIQPLLDYFKRIVMTDPIVACDDTGLTLLYPKVPPDFDLERSQTKTHGGSIHGGTGKQQTKHSGQNVGLSRQLDQAERV